MFPVISCGIDTTVSHPVSGKKQRLADDFAGSRVKHVASEGNIVKKHER